MSILVAGATGLIGSHFVSAMTGQERIYALGRSRPAECADWISCDLSQPVDTARLPTNVDTVLYLAQSEHFRDFPGRAEDILAVNTVTPHRILDWALRSGAKRFIYASSGGVYGHGQNAFREDSPIQPQGPLGFYLASKHCAEKLCENYAELLTVVIVRFFFVYGRGQRPSMLIPRLVKNVIEGKAITLQGQDGLRINPLHVDDAVRALRACCALTESTCLNLAGPDVLSLRDIGHEIGRQIGKEPRFEAASGEPRHLVGDISRMRHILGGSLTSFRDGLADYLARLGG